ncbi:MAG TPA: hypothetical protein PLP05_05705, partial [Sedimentisphaerales bacterium]|nr:hypothetical protein [Sedimentisphaerales bacterium]
MRRTKTAILLKIAILVIATVAHAGNFTLTGNDHLDVTTSYDDGDLCDFSTANIIEGGSVKRLDARNNSTVNESGGSVDLLTTYNNSIANISGGSVYILVSQKGTVNMSGGYVPYFNSSGNSIVNMSNGSVMEFETTISSTVNLSGGSITSNFHASNNSIINISDGSIAGRIRAYDDSIFNISGGNITASLAVFSRGTVIFDGYGFKLGDGLLWDIDGKTILGTGVLTGNWFDGTNW